jgi:hypothetical protein
LKIAPLITFLLSVFVHWHCALKVDDPVANLQDKIAKAVPMTDSLLRGEWLGDSTYTLRDTKAVRFEASDLQLRIFRDGRYRLRDKHGLVFESTNSGTLRRIGDSLLFVDEVTGKGPVCIGKLTFKGNYLSLYQPAKLRYAFFHRIPNADTVVPTAFLEHGFFMRTARRDSLDRVTQEALSFAFDYLTFADGRWKYEQWRQGFASADSGNYAVVADTLRLMPNAGNDSGQGFAGDFVSEFPSADSLRLWPLHEGRIDQGFSQFARRDSLPRWHRDLRPYVGYWRGDSARDDSGFMIMGFERFYDLEITTDGKVKTYAQATRLPVLNSWQLDSGRMIFSGAANSSYPLLPSTQGNAQDTLLLLENARDLGLKRLVFYGTRRNGNVFTANPVARFPHRDHAVLRFGNDSLTYLSTSAWVNAPDRAEFAAYGSTDTLWAVFALPREATFTSSQSGFVFKMQGRNSTLGKFRCSARSDLALTLRLQNEASAPTSVGTLQGQCRIDASEIPVVDTAMSVTGNYVIRRALSAPLRSPLWSM